MDVASPNYALENIFGIPGLSVTWYGIIIGIGMLAGLAVALQRAKRDGVSTDLIYDYLLIALPISILCARAYYVAFNWASYRDDPLEILAIWHGGLAIYGGVLGAILVAVLFCRAKHFSFFRFADLCVPSLVLGQAIGRWGNFANQEAFGNLVTDPGLQFFPYAVYIDRLQEWHQATFFYESMWNLVLFLLLLLLDRRTKKRGIMLPLYLMGYGAGRFFIEGLRADSLYLAPGIRVSQLLSLILLAAGAVLLWYLLRHGQSKENSVGNDGNAHISNTKE